MIDRALTDRRLARLPEVEAQLSNPATAANQRKFRELALEHVALKRLEERAERYVRLGRDVRDHRALIAADDADPELRKLARDELAGMEADLERAEQDLTMALLPPDPSDERGAIVEIRAGTGGDEAALFAGDLYRMYSRYCDRQGWKAALIDASPGALGGYKEVVFSVDGHGVYGQLRYESGGHRVQRVPATEAQGRIHTSAATVAVFPEADEQDDIQIAPDELRIDLFCASGPGGQSVNTTYSAVRITHLPTGVVVQSQDERSQQRNREKALTVLKARLLDHRRRMEEEKLSKERRALIGSGDRSERVRTYNFPQNRLTDHRINLSLHTLDRAIEGDIGEVVAALRAHDVHLRLKEQTVGA